MLSIDLTGKRAFVAGVGDDKEYGWAIVRALVQAGAAVRVGTWPPVLNIFTKSMERGKFDLSLPGGGEIEFEKIVKQQSREMKHARWEKKWQEINKKLTEWKNKTK